MCPLWYIKRHNPYLVTERRMQPWKCGHLLCTAMVSILEYLHILLFTRLTITYCLKDFHVRFLWSRKVNFCDRWLYPWYQAPPQLHLNIYQIESVQEFLIKLDTKPCMHLVEISIFSLNHVIVRLTKIMNNLLQHLKIRTFRVIFLC